MARTPDEAAFGIGSVATKRPPEIETVAELAVWLRHLRRREARARGDAPWSYRELAARTGWSRAILAEYFAGRVLPPTDRFDALVRLLGASPVEQGGLATARDRIDERRLRRGPGPTAARGTVPRQLPADAPHFVGRERELSELDAMRRAGAAAALCALTGTAGVGKTTLAVHWAHRVRADYPDGQLYVNLRGFERPGTCVLPTNAVYGFLRSLDVPPARIPSTLDGRTALYRSVTANRRLLIMVDNARDADHARPLLTGSPSSLAVVTSRDQLAGLVANDGARALRLGRFTTAEGAELLSRHLGAARVAAEPDAVRHIIDRCARLPLALSIVAARAAAQPDFPLSVHAADLATTHGRLDTLTGGDSGTDIRAVFSWSYRVLNRDAARLFRLLGLHPGPDVPVRAAASLAGLPVHRACALLGELTRANLVVEHSPKRFSCHVLLRAYAAELATSVDTAQQRQLAVDRVLDYYAQTARLAHSLVQARPGPLALGPPSAAPRGPATGVSPGVSPGIAPGVSPEPLADRRAALAWLTTEHPLVRTALTQLSGGLVVG